MSVLREIMAEYDQAKGDDSWDKGHPIFQMAEHIDELESRIREIKSWMSAYPNNEKSVGLKRSSHGQT